AAPAAPAVAPAAPAQPRAAEVPAPPPASSLGVKKAAAKPAQKTELKLAKGESSSAMPVLLAVSALLALAYGALRLMMRKNAAVEIPVIDIVAQKRLGPRHQLVIVRAFDRDYLLSIQGGQTTVVARSSRKKVETPDDMLPAMSSRAASVAAAAASRRPTAPLGRDFEDDEVTFGGELFKTALEQRDKAREQTAGFRLETARAEARAELARLDAAREDFSSSIEPVPAAVSFERELEREREREEEPRMSDPVPGAMSESVSGLLRLRKASGR
ncbi:MAG: hypothetical protein JWN48_5711, partial [Myxococcaceae bacterium]|nr:hypothetical protein [Myxococcaceae bacterium]